MAHEAVLIAKTGVKVIVDAVWNREYYVTHLRLCPHLLARHVLSK
jgi:hypothetical protein